MGADCRSRAGRIGAGGSCALKHKRLKDPKAVYMAKKFYCEVCGQRAYGDPHHVTTRGSGGPDHALNLVQLCTQCHYGDVPSAKLNKQKLWEIIARREGMEVAEIQRAVNIMRGRDV